MEREQGQRSQSEPNQNVARRKGRYKVTGWIDLGRKDVRIGPPLDEYEVDQEVEQVLNEQIYNQSKASSQGRKPKTPTNPE